MALIIAVSLQTEGVYNKCKAYIRLFVVVMISVPFQEATNKSLTFDVFNWSHGQLKCSACSLSALGKCLSFVCAFSTATHNTVYAHEKEMV